MDRREFIAEIKAKKYIREALESHQKKAKQKEQILRENIRELIKEAKSTEVPYQNTGINILHDVMKKIIPIVREDYKDLTTSKNQRKAFKKHIITAVKKSLLPIQNFHRAAQSLKSPEGKIDEEGEDRLIDVDDGSEQGNKNSDEENAEKMVGAAGKEYDETGRNLAIKTFSRIESNIIDGYELLANEQDRELFLEYLIDNIKLYFERWEEELSGEAQGEIDQDQDMPDEVLEEIDTTRPDVRQRKQKTNKQWRGWRAFKESAKKSLNEDGYKEFMDFSEEELQQKLKSLRKKFKNAEGSEIEKLEYKIGSALVALWAKLGNLS